jgi:uncharacterized protein (TIGR00299 family) protein
MTQVVRKIMVVDAQMAGVSGDMLVGALLDLGAKADRIIEAMKTLKDFLRGCKSLEIDVRDTTRRGLRAKKVDVKIEEEVTERKGAELIEAARSSIENLRLSRKAKQYVLDCLSTLVDAEARVHGGSAKTVHLHETGSVDTLADIIGSAFALEDLDLFTGAKVYSTPVAVGGGLLNFSHGTVSSPAPTTLEILRSKGFPMKGGPVEVELATPTGVSLLTNLASEFVRFYPLVKPIAVGYGAGAKDFAEMPNVLRITLGEPCTYSLLSDEIYILETNLDDATGEVIGYAVDKLLYEGARDVSIIPAFSKKNRPTQIIKVIADKASLEHLSRTLVEETGTLGVRIYPCERRVLDRESTSIEVMIDDIKELINVKVAKDNRGEIIQMKPEYKDVKKLADRTGRPLREIMDAVKKTARELLSEG